MYMDSSSSGRVFISSGPFRRDRRTSRRPPTNLRRFRGLSSGSFNERFRAVNIAIDLAAWFKSLKSLIRHSPCCVYHRPFPTKMLQLR